MWPIPVPSPDHALAAFGAVKEAWQSWAHRQRRKADDYVAHLELVAEMLAGTALALRQGRIPHYEGRVLRHIASVLEPSGLSSLDTQTRIIWTGLRQMIDLVEERARIVDQHYLEVEQHSELMDITSRDVDAWLTQMEHLAAALHVTAIDLRRFVQD